MHHRLPKYYLMGLILCTGAVVGLSLLSAQAPSDDKQEKELPKAITVDVGGTKIELVLIDPKVQPDRGVFQMGSPKNLRDAEIKKYNLKANALDIEMEHDVELTHPYYLGKFHVTRGQFMAFVKTTNYQPEAASGDGGWGWNASADKFEKHKKYTWENPGFVQTDEHPVVNVNWNDAKRFCCWLIDDADVQRQLQAKIGHRRATIRLPSEAEWEYAYRGGSKTPYFFGANEEDLAKYGNVADATAKVKFYTWKYTISAKDGYIFTSPAGTFAPNQFGLYDMNGNAWQWCEDCFDGDFYKKSPRQDPLCDTKNITTRIIRGGSWMSGPGECMGSSRNRGPKDYCGNSVGFRVALRLE